MPLQNKVKLDLDKKFRKVVKTPASFAFFTAIHDFVEHIEINSALSKSLSPRVKSNRDLGIPAKYGYLKQIYQGIEDANTYSNNDLGHDRYITICDLNRIQDGETFQNNTLWKKRETFRKLTVQIYERLDVHFSDAKK